ncbi:aromatic amino acid DMT transporter YddG [Edwardsiella piscicida]|uniref:aromatic amino acid DMT transporter YddG n=1 Tax=Edwardsiella piscicida TaxID=1263550 RepID=UPI00084CC309|nr:aromatic amino acid DMT transporter YddG [Edwardsiella piscicida]AOP42159.1 aromatic amino acid DMT transporter YddG [Edwardsiella piscicida]EKS7765641.1 aromatic amino acid DMT transporter YddG [Edwardsiella piscicida]
MKHRATLLGVCAILLWSMSVALTRSLAETLGPTAAGAAIYSLSGLLVWCAAGKPAVRGQRAGYLFGCGTLFVFYMVAFALAIGLADNRAQTLELGLINYLWPSLTLLFAVPLLGLRVRWWLWPGALLAFSGVVWVVGGDAGVDPVAMYRNLSGNPLAYALAFGAAFAWAIYSNLLRYYQPSRGALPLFLLMTALCLWLLWLLTPQPPLRITRAALGELLLMSGSTAIAYLCWDQAMKKGNATLVAALSYFTPLLSIAIAALWLAAPTPSSLWSGVLLVVLGSLLCWSASRRTSATARRD